ncbi:RmlC-like cupin domain-containing protein [Exophiala viscosa]|uniref:RmlC-like cupin domain-containing protein n=1 Tax=Exophiala viscosa TaxID=2486360 RepID=A0AAN6DX28_9EURO|nr:RmlC-like cupin domain-containing protein [Exophiala viscosa]KAI1622272.1 RmlC-like cupin domain-containing protein [Exophiala viscosa]
MQPPSDRYLHSLTAKEQSVMNSSTPTRVGPVVLPEEEIASCAPEKFDGVSRGDLSWNTLFSSSITPTNTLSAGIAVCPPKTGHLCAHRHDQAEIYYVVEGQGIVTIDGKESEVRKGTAVFIPSNAEHGIKNTGDDALKWFYAFATDAFEDVVYRFS